MVTETIQSLDIKKGIEKQFGDAESTLILVYTNYGMSDFCHGLEMFKNRLEGAIELLLDINVINIDEWRVYINRINEMFNADFPEAHHLV